MCCEIICSGDYLELGIIVKDRFNINVAVGTQEMTRPRDMVLAIRELRMQRTMQAVNNACLLNK